MSCKISTAPINLPSGINEVGGESTNLTYNYGNSSCSVTNKSTYLDISCFDGTNKVNCGLTGDLFVTGVRLYKPSLNTYNGRKADAELIITHSGGGKNLYLCIPVSSTTSKGGTAQWFSQIVPFSPSRSGSSESINVSNFSLNSIIPKAPFIVYDGGTFDWGCSKNDIMILFTLENGVSMLYQDLRTLNGITKRHSYNTVSSPDNLKFNSLGTTAGPGKKSGSLTSKTLTCTPIVDQDGKNIENSDSTTWVNKSKDFGSDMQKKIEEYWIIIIGIIVGIIVLTGLIMLLRSLRKMVGGGGSSSSSTGGST